MSLLPALRKSCDIKRFFLIKENIISDLEEQAITRLLQTKLQRKRYEGNHWDSVITKYKETELPLGARLQDTVVASAMNKVVKFLREATQNLNMDIQTPHVVDLAPDGFIGPHVDGYKFSGGLVASLSLLSARPIRLRPNDQDTEEYAKLVAHYGSRLPVYSLKDYGNDDSTLYKYRPLSNAVGPTSGPDCGSVISESESGFEIEAIVPRRSVYLLTGPLRYSYTHEVLGQKDVLRQLSAPAAASFDRRISVVFRDEFS
jgi:hypothetical protein